MNTVQELLEAWDKGDIIHTIEMGGLGPGYEQAIQIAAVEFARGCKDMQGIIPNDKESTRRFREKCDEILRRIDNDLGGLSGAQYGAAVWLAFNWCFNGGPQAVIDRHKEAKQGDRVTMASRAWPKAPPVPV